MKYFYSEQFMEEVLFHCTKVALFPLYSGVSALGMSLCSYKVWYGIKLLVVSNN